MTAFAKIRAGRVNSLPFDQYVGEAGHLFYDVTNGELRLSDGATQGGLPITITANTINTASILPDVDNDMRYGLGSETHRWHHLHLGDGGIYFDGAYSTPQTTPYLPNSINASLNPATTVIYDLGNDTYRWGNVYIGPTSLHMQDRITLVDVELAVENGTLYLNGAQNLAIGNLVILDTTLKTITAATDLSLGDSGDSGNLFINRFATITSNIWPSTASALTVNASDSATLPALPFNNTTVRIVAKAGVPGRTVTESYGTGAYGVYTARTGRGTIAAPSATQSGDVIVRLSGQGYGATKFGSVADGRIDITASENFTDSAHGTQIDFWTTPKGSNVSVTTASIDSNGFAGAGITFTADGTKQTTAGIPMTYRGNIDATKVATLGVDGKLDAGQIPSSLTGAVVFKGSWDASTNTPTLSDSLPAGLIAGWEYVVTVGGTRDIGDGSKIFASGDLVIYDGVHWKQIQGVSPFVSLGSVTGSHMLVNGNVNTTETGVLTISTDATPNNTASKIVSRDSNGSFSANIITATLAGTASSATTASTVTAAAQPNITSIGTLASLTVTGNIGAANVNANLFGTLSGNVINGNSSVNVTANSNVTITAVGNATMVITSTGANIAGTANVTGNANVGNLGTATAIITTGNITTINSGLIQNGNSNVTITANANVTITSKSNATVVITDTGANIAGTANITGNLSAGNISVATSGTLRVPKMFFNDGGIRTVSGGSALTIDFSADSMILWTSPGANATVTLANYTAGSKVRLFIRIGTTSRRVYYGVADGNNSTDGSTFFNGSGAGSINIANQCMSLDYVCYDTTAANCYVAVTIN